MVDLVIRAAGVVLIKRTPREPKILLVHRPRHRDWSLPKGKLDTGEHTIAAAVRECDEETGIVPILGVPLGRQSYTVMGRPKTVDYWMASPGKDNGFAPDDEIDEIVWANRRQARGMLTYKRDIQMVESALSIPPTTPLILLRHAAAMKRGDFKGDDARRPLTGKGRSQSRSLATLLKAYGVDAIHTSDSVRCVETVRPYADSARVTMEQEPLFSEAGFEDKPKSTIQRLKALSAEPKGIVICSHRPVLPTLLEPFTAKLGKRETQRLNEPLKPAGMVVVHRELTKGKWRVVAAERHDD